jgi:hypothetical protein
LTEAKRGKADALPGIGEHVAAGWRRALGRRERGEGFEQQDLGALLAGQARGLAFYATGRSCPFEGARRLGTGTCCVGWTAGEVLSAPVVEQTDKADIGGKNYFYEYNGSRGVFTIGLPTRN